MTALESEMKIGVRMNKRLKSAGVPEVERDAHIDNAEDIFSILVSKKDLKTALYKNRIILLLSIGAMMAFFTGVIIKLVG